MLKALVIAPATTAVAVVAGVAAFTHMPNSPLKALPTLPALAQVEEPKFEVPSILIKEMQDSSQLTTTVFHAETTMPIENNLKILGIGVGSTQLIYQAYGAVAAGVDLSQLTEESFEVVGTSVTVTLPPAKMLDSKIDIKKSRVLNYDRSLLGPDIAHLQVGQVQEQALREIEKKACEIDVLSHAAGRAESILQQMLMSAGATEVNVVQSPAENCS
ncbi:DUF4230 domain-containing protein [Pseudanabaena sp. FACHB-2040]|uniref:DUF4230 domain-containing protein n=1 Tax=Pseudanabaena sp. FACHB-2040 TaxID=2692859 RepID=UPI001688E11B|nr:DUF4230 domain-containing protein [Pseudanabaena sp. FACHB-2040]MBD2256280.1 DUF4230 domain-containing protein [Pseudanabaena sp. FACHB-2040]